MKLEFIGNQ